MDLTGIAIIAVVQCAIGGVFSFGTWFIFQRSVEKYDRLQDRVKTLEEKRIVSLEETMADHITQNSTARGALEQELRELDQRMITRVQCDKLHAELRQDQHDHDEKMLDAALKLSALGTQMTRVVGWLGEQQRDLMAAKEDIKVVLTRVEDLKDEGK